MDDQMIDLHNSLAELNDNVVALTAAVLGLTRVIGDANDDRVMRTNLTAAVKELTTELMIGGSPRRRTK